MEKAGSQLPKGIGSVTAIAKTNAIAPITRSATCSLRKGQ
jgi:hypothetical protein